MSRKGMQESDGSAIKMEEKETLSPEARNEIMSANMKPRFNDA